MTDKPPFVPGMTPQEIWQTEQHWQNSQNAQNTANKALAIAQQAGGGASTVNITNGAVSAPAAGSSVVLSSTTPTAETAGAAGSAGSSSAVSRGDHVHPMPSSLPVDVQSAGALIGTRSAINFVSGATVADNPGASRVDVTVSGGATVSVVTTLPTPSVSTDNNFYLLRQPSLGDRLFIGLHNSAGSSRMGQIAVTYPLNKTEPGGYTVSTERWFCDDLTGSTLKASISTPTDDLALTTANTFGTDTVGNYYAPASTSYAQGTTANALFSGTGDFSVEAYVKTGAGTSNRFICSQGQDTGSNPGIVFELGESASATWRLSMVTGTTNVNLTAGTVTANTLVHVIGVYISGTQTLQLFVNGVSVGTQALGGARVNPGSTKTNIGTRDGHSSGADWDGNIYFVSFYNRAIGSTEAAARFSNLY